MPRRVYYEKATSAFPSTCQAAHSIPRSTVLVANSSGRPFTSHSDASAREYKAMISRRVDNAESKRVVRRRSLSPRSGLWVGHV